MSAACALSQSDPAALSTGLVAARPIGVFDSGLGGLTVAGAVMRRLPDESLVYLGDTARVPYGTRSADTVMRYARACAGHLKSYDIKVLVVACNTVSAVALDMLRVELDVPVLGVINPGARAGVEATRNGRIGVIATRGTVSSGAYVRAVGAIDSRVDVTMQPAPLLVPLAEEGWLDGDVPRQVVTHYLKPLAEVGIDTLVLGCTHYPLLRSSLSEIGEQLCGPTLQVVDSGKALAEDLAHLLRARGLAAPPSLGLADSGLADSELATPRLAISVTDRPDHFTKVATRFLGAEVAGLDVQQVDL